MTVMEYDTSLSRPSAGLYSRRLRADLMSVPSSAVALLEQRALSNAPVHTEHMKKHMRTSGNLFQCVYENLGYDYHCKELSSTQVLTLIEVCISAKPEYGKFNLPTYKYISFRDTYIPNLFRYWDAKGYTYEDDLRARCKNKMRLMLNNKEIDASQVPTDTGANPMTMYDLEHIIASIPKSIPDRMDIASWCVLTSAFGLRGISMDGLHWKHVHISRAHAPGFFYATLLFTTTKGSSTWNKRMTIVGNLSSEMSPLYWLETLLQAALNNPQAQLLKLAEYMRVGQLSGDLKLLPQHREAISTRLSAVSKYCGYPEGHFSLHSCRSGFLSTAVLKRARKGLKIHWEEIAIAQGWSSADCRNMMVYVKNALRRVMIINSLVAFDEELPQGTYSLVAEELMTPAQFHGLETALVPCWPIASRKSFWDSHLAAAFSAQVKEANRPDLSVLSYLRHRSALYKPFYSWMRHRSKFKGLIEKCILPKVWSSWCPLQRAMSALMTDVIEESTERFPLHEFFSSCSSIILQIVKEFEYRGGWKKSSTHTQHHSKSPRAVDNKSHRRRIVWSAHETTVLCARWLDTPCKWVIIQDHPSLELRSSLDCKDKMRSLCKELHVGSNSEAVEKWLSNHHL